MRIGGMDIIFTPFIVAGSFFLEASFDSKNLYMRPTKYLEGENTIFIEECGEESMILF